MPRVFESTEERRQIVANMRRFAQILWTWNSLAPAKVMRSMAQAIEDGEDMPRIPDGIPPRAEVLDVSPNPYECFGPAYTEEDYREALRRSELKGESG